MKREEALELAGGALEEYCEGQFAICPTGVLCFFDIGEGAGTANFTDPDRLVWRPKDPNLEEWLPEAVRIWPSKERPPGRLFVRKDSDEYRDLGLTNLSSAGGYPGQVTASFSLREKLPRDAWLELSGFDGWTIVANHRVFDVEKGDQRSLEKILKPVLTRRSSHIEFARYEGDSLQVFFNRERAWVMYLRTPSDTGLYVEPDPEVGEEEEIFRCKCGIDLEFPRSNTIEREPAVEIIRAYFQAGAVPRDVAWTDEVP